MGKREGREGKKTENKKNRKNGFTAEGAEKSLGKKIATLLGGQAVRRMPLSSSIQWGKGFSVASL